MAERDDFQRRLRKILEPRPVVNALAAPWRIREWQYEHLARQAVKFKTQVESHPFSIWLRQRQGFVRAREHLRGLPETAANQPSAAPQFEFQFMHVVADVLGWYWHWQSNPRPLRAADKKSRTKTAAAGKRLLSAMKTGAVLTNGDDQRLLETLIQRLITEQESTQRRVTQGKQYLERTFLDLLAMELWANFQIKDAAVVRHLATIIEYRPDPKTVGNRVARVVAKLAPQ